MGMRHPNYRRLKQHHSYSVQDLASVLACHQRTVLAWRKAGLQPVDTRRPMLFDGKQAIVFLKIRRAKAKRPCGPGQLYCLRCRTPQYPAGGMAEYQALTPRVGTVSALCPACHCLIYRRVNQASLEAFQFQFDVTIREAPRRISETVKPFVNCPFKSTGET